MTEQEFKANKAAKINELLAAAERVTDDTSLPWYAKLQLLSALTSQALMVRSQVYQLDSNQNVVNIVRVQGTSKTFQ